MVDASMELSSLPGRLHPRRLWRAALASVPPPELVQGRDESARTARMLLTVWLAGLPWPLVFALCFWPLLDCLPAALACVAGALGFLAVPSVWRATRNTRVAANAMLGVAAAQLFSLALLTGGALAPAADWLLVLPLVAVTLVGVRWTIAWTAVAVGILIALQRVEYMGLKWPSLLDERAQASLQFLGHVGLILLMISLAGAYEWQRRWMLSQLAAREQALRETQVEIAQQAGRAEVAANVIHNVGNVLNSLNVAATLMGDKLRRSELPSLRQAVELLEAHRENLGDFLARDERGQHLPALLSELSRFLAEEHDAMLAEVRTLATGIEHVRHIVELQNIHKKGAALIESLEPREIVEQALALHAAAFARHRIRVERSFEPTGKLPLDKHKVLQVLVNVISNAKKAVVASGRTDRTIAVSVARAADGGVRISIADNGVGIAPEDLKRIFSFGFTTHRDGHGIGLPNSMNLAELMGGRLRAESEGKGRGATFTLELPANPPTLVHG
ncbi:MAG: sensor histidine kinase [Phycisphaerae bacterium]|nr:sensor histidine kinase [Phycisphaerae bacterium]MCZ2400567.1 sensor histidine kinase [Phycisphaerae bacterium]NUQ49694.1 sensor histidine kinase [Phycisphaerae bacterium]